MFALLRILITLAIIAGIGYGGLFALDYFVDPEITERSKTVIIRPL